MEPRPLFDTELIKSASYDTTARLLRIHLVAEQALIELLRQRATEPTKLDAARLTFAALVKLAAAFVRVDPADVCVWEALVQLNAVRNAVAHTLQPNEHRFDDATMAKLKRLFETVLPYLPDYRWPSGRPFFEWKEDSAFTAINAIGEVIGERLNRLDLRAASA